ncbi:MAG: glycosyltransferase [Patulibacter sp.]
MTVPTVSVVIPCFNYADYVARAIDSALAQEWPTEALEIIVVDDGSTDRSAEIISSYGDQIIAIHQQNGGLISAVNAGVELATGDYIALLDADDVWPANRLCRQIAFLEDHPEVGMLHGDLRLIDAHDRPTGKTLFELFPERPARGRIAGQLLTNNVAWTSATVVRASLLDACFPIPSWPPWADWWIAFAMARVSRVDYLDKPVTDYREHGDNALLGAKGERFFRALARELPLRRSMLRDVVPGQYRPIDLIRAVLQLHITLRQAADGLGQPQASMIEAADEALALQELGLADAFEREGRLEAALCAITRAFAADPLNDRAAAAFERCATRLTQGEAPTPDGRRADLAPLPATPRVSCIISGDGDARQVGAAVESALAQRWPDLEVLVVAAQDGAIDAQFERYGGQVRVIGPPRGGASVIDAGIAAATGELIAFLPASGRWPAHHIATLAAGFETHRQAGLICRADSSAICGSARGVLLERGDLVRLEATMVRASLRHAFTPIPPHAPSADWWIASRIAELAELHVAAGGLADLPPADHDPPAVAHIARAAAFRLAELRALAPGQAAAAEITRAVAELDRQLAELEQVGAPLATATAAETIARAQVASHSAEHALRAGDTALAAALAANAIGEAPGLPEPRQILARVVDLVAAVAASIQLRGLGIIADARELVARPELLAAYAEQVTGDDDITLLVTIPVADQDAWTRQLIGCVDRAGLDTEHGADLLASAVSDPSGLAGRLHAILGAAPMPPGLGMLARLETAADIAMMLPSAASA